MHVTSSGESYLIHFICNTFSSFQTVLRMDYLVHDFYSMCKSLRHNSRTVFIDMGASLAFHSSGQSPNGKFDRLDYLIVSIP